MELNILLALERTKAKALLESCEMMSDSSRIIPGISYI